jgi:hypothetical protein
MRVALGLIVLPVGLVIFTPSVSPSTSKAWTDGFADSLSFAG